MESTVILENVSVLLVEDDDFDAEAVERGFIKHQLDNRIVRARDGVEALKLLRDDRDQWLRNSYVVLLDINMPRMNGFEFLDELRKDRVLRDSVVFILTTSDDERDRLRSYRDFNIAGYLNKAQAGPGFRRGVEMLTNYWSETALRE